MKTTKRFIFSLISLLFFFMVVNASATLIATDTIRIVDGGVQVGEGYYTYDYDFVNSVVSDWTYNMEMCDLTGGDEYCAVGDAPSIDLPLLDASLTLHDFEFTLEDFYVNYGYNWYYAGQTNEQWYYYLEVEDKLSGNSSIFSAAADGQAYSFYYVDDLFSSYDSAIDISFGKPYERVEPIPEPETIVLILSGLLLFTFTSYRTFSYLPEKCG